MQSQNMMVLKELLIYLKNTRTMKQTAVEWLVEQITDSTMPAREAIKQAKEMEKEQIIEFADEYGTYLLQVGTMSAVTYMETFNKSIKNKG